MPAKYHVHDSGSLVIEKWSGLIGHDEMIRHIMRRMHDPAIERGAAVLADGRQATFETPEDQAQAVADTHTTTDDRMRGARVAMIVREDVLVRANLFALSAAKHRINVMVFEHFDVGCLWLGISTARAERLLAELDDDDEQISDAVPNR